MATYEFDCASPVCDTRLTALTRNEMVAQMTEHVKIQHRIPLPTKPILQFLADNTIREIGRTKGRP